MDLIERNQNDTGFESVEQECRYCLEPASTGRLLYHPCRCSGSIRYVHKDCLVQAIIFSKQSKCTTCRQKFSFVKGYVLLFKVCSHIATVNCFFRLYSILTRHAKVDWNSTCSDWTLCSYQKFIFSLHTWYRDFGICFVFSYHTIISYWSTEVRLPLRKYFFSNQSFATIFFTVSKTQTFTACAIIISNFKQTKLILGHF